MSGSVSVLGPHLNTSGATNPAPIIPQTTQSPGTVSSAPYWSGDPSNPIFENSGWLTAIIAANAAQPLGYTLKPLANLFSGSTNGIALFNGQFTGTVLNIVSQTLQVWTC